MKIAELFYPRELKEIIRKLEAEDNLRREPLDPYNRETILIVLVYSIVIPSSLLEGEYIGFIILAIMHYFLFMWFRKLSNQRFFSYCSGASKTVLVENIKFRVPMNVLITYKIKESGVVKTVRLPSYLKRAKLLKGQELTFYCLDDGDGMPDIPIFKHHFCLRKDLMKGTSDG